MWLFIRFVADVYLAACYSGQQSQGSSSAATSSSQTSSSSSSSSSLPSNLSYTSYILKQTPQVGRECFLPRKAILRDIHIHVYGGKCSSHLFLNLNAKRKSEGNLERDFFYKLCTSRPPGPERNKITVNLSVTLWK